MSCTPGLCTRYLADALRGVHHEDDRYMLALYGESAQLDPSLTDYTAKGEMVGDGYKAGGVQLKGFEVVEDGMAVVLTFDDAHWERVTLTRACGGLVYNASKRNLAVGVVKLAQPTSSTNGAFDVFFPLPTAADGLFVIT